MTPLPPPSGFRGTWHTGDRARSSASRVSGPFQAAPRVYAVPADRDDLRRIVRTARSEGIPIVPRGAGTGMPGGNLGPGIVLSLAESFQQISPVDPEARTIRAGAGVSGARVDEVARAHGLTLPPLPSSARWCSVGGMVANNAAGARSFGHGAMHRWVRGVEGVDAFAEPFALGRGRPKPSTFEALDRRLRPAPPETTWPQVRKNSSGYALDRYRASGDPAQLLIGSEGTLGIMTEAELRLHPTPEVHGLRIIAVHGAREASELAVAAADTGAVACEFLGHRFLEMARLADDAALAPLVRDAWALFLLEFEGTADQVAEGLEATDPRKLPLDTGGPADRRTRSIQTIEPDEIERLRGLRRRASPLIAREAERGRISTQFIEDCVVPPARLGDYLVGLDEILESAGFDAVIFGHAGDGNVHVNPLIDVESTDWRLRVRTVLDETTTLVAGLGGTMAGEHGDGRLRAPLLERIWGTEWFQRFRAVKDHFDPEGVLNPGVIIPLPGQDPLDGLSPRKRSWPT
ncbi:MAG: FAD-binding oxidoreductase [Gemmatimonadales bacterium]|nr:MAG: FAD-binding oxidoreductase [Gemmatimonadales bacterium]